MVACRRPTSMCGFAAVIAPGRHLSPDLMGAMERDLHHRGPDSGGGAAEEGWAVRVRRLAILDPSAGADMPMTDSSGRFTLIYNGEIYNFRALRAELAAVGVVFRTQGDSEVLLEGYKRWGDGVLQRLEGMYAFLIIDRVAGEAVAARDPFGIKPLYLRRAPGMVGLASEMRPLHRLGPVAVDEAALAELLTFGFAAGRMGNLRGIDRVPGGTVLHIRLADGRVAERRFCDVLETIAPDEGADLARATAAAAAALAESIRAHLVSDVGYTVQLSGGVDSSLVVALATGAADRTLTSFGVSLGEHPFDEGAWRQQVVARYRLDHHEVPLDGHRFADALPRAVRHMEGPVPHGGCVALMLLCEEARAVSKVILTGEGADEFFGGYLRYGLWSKLAWQERLGRLLPPWLWPDTWPVQGVRRLAGRDAAIYAAVYHDFAGLERLFPGLVPGPGARAAASARFSDFRDRLFAVDQTAYLESLLVRQDKMSMAASVEARVPFVHLPLARVLNRLPRRLRVPGGVTKPLLKRLAEPHLPHDLLHRRKIGLWLPYDDWLADPGGLGRYLDLLAEPGARLASYAGAALGRVVESFRAGRRRGLPPLFTLVNTELWLRSLEGQS
ncbi:MAG: asparagine synthase (glutamine-hydrolyzing) [Alphaproteobacteria bacterium]|nr:asparagine synthase (glutamine-hydrolyzing) [Alphaproteobacteria bacterium]